ncbi:MAG TPA: M23 family metallopeptidase [Methylomirabilota bacterium]|nr:M23 family metallopeptidase [Methylomirabilota bacterium]
MNWYVARTTRGRLLHHLQFLSADGSRSRVIHVPRVATCVVATVTLAALGAVGYATAEYLYLKTQAMTLAAAHREAAEQRALVESFQQRIGEVRKEIATWREIHARMAEPFGPDGGSSKTAAAATGIGGGTAQVRQDPEGEKPQIYEEVEALATSVLEEGPKVRALERVITSAGRAIQAMPSRWPVRGAVNSEFGRRKSPWGDAIEHHSGLDIAAQMATPVKAPATGTVVFAGQGGEYGLCVILDHGNEVKSLYGHLSKIQVRQGQRIDRGTIIALTGNTGRSSGPHLHYEVHVKGQAVNPRAFLWAPPDRS